MYISNWDEFQKAAIDIYVASPEQTRYVHTFHRGNGELVLKVTDDRTNIKYKTNQMTDLKKFISLNSDLMLQMMSKGPIEEDTIMAEATEQAPKAAPSKTKATAPKQAPKGKKGKKRR